MDENASVCLRVMVCLSLCLQSLSRLVRVVPTLFLSVIDACGPAAISESLGGAGAMIQQHLLTVLAASLLSSRNHMQRFTQKVCVYLCLKRQTQRQTQINIPNQHFWWHSVIYIILVWFFLIANLCALSIWLPLFYFVQFIFNCA